MVLKCKKIPNVDKKTCTAEQKIAYNYAFSYSDIGRKILESNKAECVKIDAFFDIENLVINDLKRKSEMKKYNIDAVIIAFRQGFRTYCEKFFIATTYKQIGDCFKIPYTIE